MCDVKPGFVLEARHDCAGNLKDSLCTVLSFFLTLKPKNYMETEMHLCSFDRARPKSRATDICQARPRN